MLEGLRVKTTGSGGALLLLVAGLTSTVFAAFYVARTADARDQIRLEAEATDIASRIRTRIDAHVTLLRGAAGLDAALGTLDQARFAGYVERLGVAERYPGVQGIGYCRAMTSSEVFRFEAEREHELGPGFRVWPAPQAGGHHAHVVITYLEPRDRRNAAALGFDMASEPTRREAMLRAAQTKAPAASHRVTLVQEIDREKQPGFLIYVPLRERAEPPSPKLPDEEAFGEVEGFVYAPFRAHDLLNGIFGPSEAAHDGIAFAVADVEPEVEPVATDADPDARATSLDEPLSSDSLLYTSPGWRDAVVRARSGTSPLRLAFREPALHAGRRIDVAGVPWMLSVRTLPSFAASSDRRFVPYLLVLGSTASALLALAMFVQVRLRRRAEHVASELRRSEEALRESEGRLRRVVESNVIGIVVGDLQGAVLEVNDAFLALTGHDRDAVRDGRLDWVAVCARDDVRGRAALAAMATDAQRSEAAREPYEKEIVRPDGTRVPVLVGVSFLGGREELGVGFVLDLSERKRAEAQLERARALADAAREQAEAASRLKDEFLATVSHELRTPLNAILGWAQLLRTHPGSREELERALTTIERNAKAQAKLIDDLLDVSRIISGKLALDLTTVDLRAVLHAALEAVRPAASAKKIALTCDLPDAACFASGDPTRLQQIAWNLLSNAVKFTPPSGNVDVTLRRTDAGVLELSVRDSGQGIDPAFLPHVFERFRQADGSTTRRHGGLGLGLAIARQLVELHGGTIEASSEGVGRGATFVVRLPPFDEARAARHEGHEARPSTLAGVRVLLVDDDEDALRLAECALARVDARVTTVTSAESALRAYERERPDVLVSDISMPGEDGYTLLRRVRTLETRLGGRVPAVALTAFARDEDKTRARLAGFEEHLAKPVETARLLEVVATLAKKQAERPTT
jgi:PAS domain S-box-containing protein